MENFNSRLLSLYPYEKVDIGKFQKVFQVDEEAIQYEINRLLNRYLTWEVGEEVHSGDMVVCSLMSSVDKFQKENIKVIVDSGMFHKSLEHVLIGMHKNEKKTVVLEEGEVQILVKEIQNRVVPNLTNEMVQALNLETVSTIEEYQSYLISEQKQKMVGNDAYHAIKYIMSEVDCNSDLILKQADWKKMAELELAKYRNLSKQMDLVLEQMTKEDFDGKIPVASYFELVTLVQDNAWDTLIHYLIGKYYADQEGYVVSEAEYEQFIEEYIAAWRVTEEQARESQSYELFVVTSYAGCYYQKVKKYVEERIYVEA
ncbi:hypothetical protein [Scatolibacter rhodanostii]|uniref:hypothetical protein n=1 Tax=Scatolibacter rhodanostii TaxID=2014781 RepID=UPI000C06D239|nr:hypothetical protein [Scatolibacter rhodanostii]